jgi:hypothetical protein
VDGYPIKFGKRFYNVTHSMHDVKIQVVGQAVKLRGWKMVRNIDK